MTATGAWAAAVYGPAALVLTFVRLADGSISIGEAAGHTHSLTNPENAAMADDLAKSLTAAQADLAKSRGLVAVAVALPPEQASYAKRLSGDALDAYLK